MKVKTHAQESKAQELLDSMSRTYASTPDSVHVKNFYRLIELSNEEQNNALYALSLTYISPYIYEKQDFQAYEEIINLSLEVAKDTMSVSKEMYVSILNNAAALEKIKGNYLKSKAMYLNALNISKKNMATPFQLYPIYHNITSCYNLLADYDNAYLNSLQELKCIISSHPDDYSEEPEDRKLDIARAYYAIGTCLKSEGKFEEAKEKLNISISYLSKYSGPKQNSKSREFINNYVFLCEIALQEGSQEEALDYIKKVVKLQYKIKYKTYKTLELQGLYHQNSDQFSNAIEEYRKAILHLEKRKNKNKEFPTIARIQMRIGDSYVLLDSLKKAIHHYHSGLNYFDNNLNTNLKNNPEIELISANLRCFEILHKKAKVSLDLFRINGETEIQEVAKSTYSSLLELIDNMKNSYLKDGSKYYIADLAQDVYHEYLDLLYETQDINKKYLSNEKTLNLIEKNKATILFSSIEKKYAYLSSNLPFELIQKEQELRTDIGFYTKELKTLTKKAGQVNASKIKTTKQKVFELNESYAILNNKIKTEHPDFFELTQDKSNKISFESIQSQLNADQIFIEFYESEKYIYSYSISKQKTHFHRQEKNEELVNSIDGYFDYISTLPSSKTIGIQTAIQQSELIYSSIVDPILEAHGHPTDLLVVMDGKMSKLPLESLLIQNEGSTKHDYFIKTHEVAYFYSIRQLITNDTEVKNDEVTVLGLAPVFGGESGESRSCSALDLKALPFAQDELDYLSNNFNGSFLSDQLATTSTLLNSMGDYSVIHLATHACLNSEEPMLNQIHLADGTLTNYDIMNLNVSPDLVVLSACNTAQGDYKEGEGIISLSRGFFEAGVKSMQSALWEMNDYSSSKIVQGMYENLKKGKRKSSALRASKLDYIASAEKIRSHPYFWAGMIQIGNDNPIIEKSNSMLHFIILGLLLIAGIFLFRKYKSKNKLAHR